MEKSTSTVLRGGNGGNAISLTRPGSVPALWHAGVDHERACVYDLLAERSADSFALWLAAHSSVEIITRDRSSEYAKAATEAAPQAVQVADRFHLVGNLVEMLALLLARCRAEIRGAEQGIVLPEEPEPALPTPAGWKPRNPEQAARAAAAHDVQRADRYQQVLVLRSHGLTWEAVAQRMGLSPKTIRKWMAHEGPPIHALRGSHRSGKFGPTPATCWNAGRQGSMMGHNSIRKLLHRAIVAPCAPCSAICRRCADSGVQ